MENYSPKFTQDWFFNRIPQWKEWLAPYKNKIVKCMEIGVFEGRASLWLLENIVTDYNSVLFAVDTFKGGDDQVTHGIEISKLREIYEYNISPYQKDYGDFRPKVRIFEEQSQTALLKMVGNFDFIYIDGSHLAADVFIDAANSWRLLRIGGTIIFDDYAWRVEEEPHKCPYLAIDAFLECFKGRYERLSDKVMMETAKCQLQVAIRKIYE